MYEPLDPVNYEKIISEAKQKFDYEQRRRSAWEADNHSFDPIKAINDWKITESFKNDKR